MTDRDTIATYQSVADEYEERHRDRSVVRELVEEFLAALDVATDSDAARVADVGCGPGWESAAFADRGHEVVGVDLTPAFLRDAADRAPNASFARMDMRRLGVASDAFDGLWACASFLHVPREDAPATLREFRRVLRPGGVLCLSVARGDGETVGDTYDDDRRRFTLYRADELRELVADAGFEVESVADGDWIQVFGRA
ncbi:class I SAM-dependent methyltransferase [Halorussus gelatinilyticus]|uniref:Class I SAM-dependent methyltransferase n=1 Tax=Halorussus gelatinilyticus TaxID=2937524 RepID=A0A8U0IFS1_9EURY|nr:class I SAM-dependent methyltransferase [Halorussus gelatinilyticus]UPV99584.1 class I SAM-dependent methyltransferase [Halorussus gelatinilyticus]